MTKQAEPPNRMAPAVDLTGEAYDDDDDNADYTTPPPAPRQRPRRSGTAESGVHAIPRRAGGAERRLEGEGEGGSAPPAPPFSAAGPSPSQSRTSRNELPVDEDDADADSDAYASSDEGESESESESGSGSESEDTTDSNSDSDAEEEGSTPARVEDDDEDTTESEANPEPSPRMPTNDKKKRRRGSEGGEQAAGAVVKKAKRFDSERGGSARITEGGVVKMAVGVERMAAGFIDRARKEVAGLRADRAQLLADLKECEAQNGDLVEECNRMELELERANEVVEQWIDSGKGGSMTAKKRDETAAVVPYARREKQLKELHRETVQELKEKHKAELAKKDKLQKNWCKSTWNKYQAKLDEKQATFDQKIDKLKGTQEHKRKAWQADAESRAEVKKELRKEQQEAIAAAQAEAFHRAQDLELDLREKEEEREKLLDQTVKAEGELRQLQDHAARVEAREGQLQGDLEQTRFRAAVLEEREKELMGAVEQLESKHMKQFDKTRALEIRLAEQQRVSFTLRAGMEAREARMRELEAKVQATEAGLQSLRVPGQEMEANLSKTAKEDEELQDTAGGNKLSTDYHYQQPQQSENSAVDGDLAAFTAEFMLDIESDSVPEFLKDGAAKV